MVNDNLEKKVMGKNINEGIDLVRVGYTTAGYAILGSFAPNPEIVSPVAGAVGLAASVYDEITGMELDLLGPAVAGLVGGIIGSWFDFELVQSYPHLTTYAGAAIGVALGTYNSLVAKRK